MSHGTLDTAGLLWLSCTGLSPSVAGFPNTFPLTSAMPYAVRTPPSKLGGLGSSGFARRYSRNRVFFLFLGVLRCFSSPGSLPHTMYSCTGDRPAVCRVAPFRYLRINGYLLLPEAFRSLSRLSSALSAKASTIRSCSSDLFAGAFSVTHLQTVLLFLRLDDFSSFDEPSSFGLFLIYSRISLGCLVI